VARGRTGDWSRRRVEPRPCRRAARPPASARRPRRRDGRQPRPPAAEGDPRPQRARAPARRGHDPPADPGDHPRPHARGPRRRRRQTGPRARPRGRRGTRAARRPLVAGRKRRPAGRYDAKGADELRTAAHAQRLRGGVRRPLCPLRAPAPGDQRQAPWLRGRRAVAGPRPGRRARQLGAPRHEAGVRARQGARRRAACPRHRHAALHVRPGHPPAALGRGEAQPFTRAAFSRWIFRIAPFLRASGSGASAPRSTSADR
jgi:hypothetical protein